MFPFMFVIRAIPSTNNHNYGIVGGAFVHIWVIDFDIDSAKQKALSFIKRQLWDVQSIEHALAISSEQIPLLHKSEALLYNSALQNGIAADFLAYSITDSDDCVRIDNP